MAVIMLGGNPPGLAPNELGTLLFWYDFSDTATLFTDTARTSAASDGNTVKGVTDKGPNGYHLTEATNGPTLRTSPAISFNGRAALEFDGANDRLTSAVAPTINSYSRSNAATIFAVCAHDTAQGAEGGGWNPSTTVFYQYTHYVAGSNNGGSDKIVSANATSSTWHIARKASTINTAEIATSTILGNGAADPGWDFTIKSGVNDTRDASLADGGTGAGNWLHSGTTAALNVGSGGGAYFWNGFIVEVFGYYNQSITEDQRKDLERRLAWKYGITLPY